MSTFKQNTLGIKLFLKYLTTVEKKQLLLYKLCLNYI